MVSGGGKDRKVVLWGHDYRKQAEMEVRDVTCPVSFKDIFFFFFLSSRSLESLSEEDMTCSSSLCLLVAGKPTLKVHTTKCCTC